MNTTHNLKKVIVGALLSGGIALAGLTAGTAQASPQPIDPSINTSDFNVPVTACTQCHQTTLQGRPEVHPNGGNKGGTDGNLPGRPEVRHNGANKYNNDNP